MGVATLDAQLTIQQFLEGKEPGYSTIVRVAESVARRRAQGLVQEDVVGECLLEVTTAFQRHGQKVENPRNYAVGICWKTCARLVDQEMARRAAMKEYGEETKVSAGKKLSSAPTVETEGNHGKRGPDGPIISAQEYDIFLRAFRTLELVCRQLIVWQRIWRETHEKKPRKEIAARLGIEENAVGVRLYRCIRKLTEEMERLKRK